MVGDLLARVRAAMVDSELLRDAASVRRDGGLALALDGCELRQLHAEEITRLEAQGNSADDWSRVRVAVGFDWRRVRQCEFHGDIVLGRFDWRYPLADDLKLPSGVYRSTLADCVIGHEALVRDVRLLAQCVIAPCAAVIDCGSVTCDPSTTFGTAINLALGIETGGRDVAVFAELDVDIAAAVTRACGQRPVLERYTDLVHQYGRRAVCGRGVVGRGAMLRHVARVHNAYIGPFACVAGATTVSDVTLLSNDEERTLVENGACVRDSVLQWGARVDSLAIVQRSVLTEHSYAERHAKVTDSLLGPNTGVAEGEVTACLLGPFVSFHHQALLIATLWPEGKGNVSHGANVGSNHTGKAPDQEFWPGEGTFLGLGVNVKFPVNLSRAPYALIAFGVHLLPQRIEFPFSLVNGPSVPQANLPPGCNEIMPAWLLSDNLYTIYRNEAKYRARNRARRAHIEFDVFRPDTVDLMRDALERLEAVPAVQEIYTERDIRGLGRNYLTEARRQVAIAAYRFFIRRYALLGLKAATAAALQQGSSLALDSLLNAPADQPHWEHQRMLLRSELGVTDVAAALRELPPMLEKVGRSVERSKAKDDQRGVRIIDDYAEAHPAATEDPIVQLAQEEARRLQKEVHDLLGRLECQGTTCKHSAILALAPLAG